VTSPDYLGRICDIKAIAEVCRRHGAYLLVDNAHGAYTAFLEKSLHPIALGADMCCDSAHKTLPVLTGGAYLHTGNKSLAGRAKENMSIFCSTSPSYMILQSLDLCNKYLSEDFPAELAHTAETIKNIKEELSPPYEFCGSEPLKLTIHTASSGLYGTELGDILRRDGIECEYADKYYLVLMLSPRNTAADLEKIKNTLKNVRMPKIAINAENIHIPPMKREMSIRDAVFSECEYVGIKNAAGRICGKAVTLCPPGIAAAVPGELISADAAESLEKYGISGINVVK
jgi:arginine/lysine/ornithine decarboxylase